MRFTLVLLAGLLGFALLPGCSRWKLVEDGPAAQAKQAEAASPEKDDSGTALSLASLKGPRYWFTPKPPPPPQDTLVLRGNQLVAQAPVADGTGASVLAGGHELYRRGEYKGAEQLFHSVAENTKAPPAIAEEARFYEAECLRRQDHLPRACDTYHKLLLDYSSGVYRDQAVQRIFDIAEFWLKDTKIEMEMYEEKKAGKRWFVITPVVHFEKKKPFFDQEGRALEALDHVRLHDATGQFADKAMFLAGSVKFWREDFQAADTYFSMLLERFPNSPLAPKAVELGIIAKHMSTGGSDYDARKVAEARKLVNTALQNYPTLAVEKKDFLMRQLVNCNLQQAEKDFKIAEFYRRTGHPASAWFYYEIVRRRYWGTRYADEATQRMMELRAQAQKDGLEVPPVPHHASPAPSVTDASPKTR